jgi:DNA-3-methyladenine glycosylase II
MASFEISPQGPFDLATAQDFAGGFAPGLGGDTTVSDHGILMTFPIEDGSGSAAVDLRQDTDGRLRGEVYGTSDVASAAAQAAHSLSLDVDGSAWPMVGERDPVVGRLQAQYGMLRPVCFYSPYEAATSFVIGARISMRQGARIKAWLAEHAGDAIELSDGRSVHAFPRPAVLHDVDAVPGLAAEKVRRLQGIAEAAMAGELSTARLRSMPAEAALAELQRLPGVGPWTASGILMRGAGTPDTLPLDDAIGRAAIQRYHELPAAPSDEAWLAIAERWRPYRMWATVLLHMALRREHPEDTPYGGPGPRRSARAKAAG